jgi:ParB family chromosome partitioning protein
MDEFPNHPFKVEMDEDMRALMESISTNGVIDPLILRIKEDGRYEIIAGHRRKKACELLGIKEVPAETRRMSREEATIMMIESNLHRSHILPSEKALAYKMRLEAENRQGERTDLTCGQIGHKLANSKTRDLISDEKGDSGRQISRFIRLTELIPGILNMVDEQKMGFNPAVELSYLKKEEQEMLLDVIKLTESTPSIPQAKRMRELSKNDALTPRVLESILREQKPNQKEQIKVRYELAQKYLPSDMAYSDYEEYILRALKYYSDCLERQRDDPER